MTYVIAVFPTKVYDPIYRSTSLVHSTCPLTKLSKTRICKPWKTDATRFQHPRLTREARTIEAMIQITCHAKHDTKRELCSECQELLDYALLRLEKCPFQELKSTCVTCQVHCYRAEMRERIRQVMRYAGPHMVYRHPYLAFMHLVVDSRREAPELPKRRDSSS